MGSLSYTASISLDGFVADASGDLQWGAPSEEVFRFHVERIAAVSTEVLGRTTYGLMRYWESEPDGEHWGPLEREFARRWRRIEQIVVSSTLSPSDLANPDVPLLKTLELPELARIVDDAPGEVEIFGPTTASKAIRAGMVHDFRFFLVPKSIGGGLPALPAGAELDLRLVEHRVFDNGTVLLHYAAR